MPFFFDHYPYTNFHNVNLDWVLQAVKAWGEMVEQNNQNFINLDETMTQFKLSLQADWLNYQDTINQEYEDWARDIRTQWVTFWNEVRNYLHDLDVSQEISDKLDEMLTNGDLADIINPTIVSTTQTWLNNNITPTTPAIDKTLTISGAGADSLYTGYVRDNIYALHNSEYNVLNPYIRVKDITSIFNPPATYTSAGVNYVNTNGTVTANGTVTSNFSFYNFLASGTAIPAGMKKDCMYRINFNSNDNNIFMHVQIRRGDAQTNYHFNNNQSVFYLPNDATGIYIRLFTLRGIELNATITGVKLEQIGNCYISNSNDDITSKVLYNLTEYKYCKLGEGEFIIDGLVMPIDSSLEGCGRATIVKLKDSESNNFIVRTNDNCSINDITFTEHNTTITLSDTPTNIHGIEHISNYPTPTIEQSTLHVSFNNLRFYGFTGSALYLNNTGEFSDGGIVASNLRFNNCNIAININRRCEYCSFIGINITRCYYGIINNGSSNTFTGGDISSCYIGYFMDGTDDKPNIGHSIVTGFTINHFLGSDGTTNTGIAIYIKNTNSITFADSNIAFGSIELYNAKGILFTSIHYGNRSIVNINDTDCTILFNGCTATASYLTINLNGNTMTKFDNCYYRNNNAQWSA